MTPDNESISNSARPNAAGSTQKHPWRRRLSAVGAGLAVIGFSAALLAPTGTAVADPSAGDESVTAFSLAAQDTQDLTVTVEGASMDPVDRGAFDIYVKPKPKPKPEPKAQTASGGGSSSRPKYTGGGSKEQWMAAAGIAASDYAYVDYIVRQESGWNPNATNRSSGACGLVQALPCSKVPGNGYNPVDNLRWGTGYAKGRYGSWAGAYAFWTRNHWW
ncbi:transglycosylase SLT domain-containing protein [Microbacterium sp. ARD32]|uniref:aggregation-promoting factor C-terminal-like domain-containing protein n=1 Tax=Microbacterium sp. ARD32 TaxID=2962577 RepID=UPI002881B69A|nr:transglycosylase SLT domain-containing protein [Microbacterium sp. ARD32]MDT0157075.1 transglycosylase SLT domain-containing protein [Microbacterium sp. ARD32]